MSAPSSQAAIPHRLVPQSDEEGLSRVVNLLDAGGFDYWLDSGALLGLVRDGHELAWDSDIDLGVWGSDIEMVGRTLKALRRMGYWTAVHRYRGRIYEFTLEDKRDRAFRPVHIHVYYRHGDLAWSPQTVTFEPMARPGVDKGFARRPRTRSFLVAMKCRAKAFRGGENRSMLGALSYAAWGAMVLVRNRLDRAQWAGIWPYSTIYTIYTWVVPSHHFITLDWRRHGDLAIPIPADVESYLERRYGAWRKPVADWCYWTDDGCIRAAPPEAIIPCYQEISG